jgi:integrase
MSRVPVRQISPTSARLGRAHVDGHEESSCGRASSEPPATRFAVELLREHLIRHRLRSGRTDGLVFGRTANEPCRHWTIVDRAMRAWREAKLAPIRLHEARHTFASLMIAAGVNAPKALSVFMGHASITITLDRYGHLFPDGEDEAARLLDDYITRERTRVGTVTTRR